MADTSQVGLLLKFILVSMSSTAAVRVSLQAKALSSPRVRSMKKNMTDIALAARPNVGMADAMTMKASPVPPLEAISPTLEMKTEGVSGATK